MYFPCFACVIRFSTSYFFVGPYLIIIIVTSFLLLFFPHHHPLLFFLGPMQHNQVVFLKLVPRRYYYVKRNPTILIPSFNELCYMYFQPLYFTYASHHPHTQLDSSINSIVQCSFQQQPNPPNNNFPYLFSKLDLTSSLNRNTRSAR